MNILTKTDLKSLIDTHEAPCISIFMPTHRAGGDTRQDPIRLKNLMREGEERLEKLGLKPAEREALLKPISPLILEMPLWRNRGDGLAIFRSKSVFRHYRLPLPLDALVMVEEQFHIKPLLPLFIQDRRYYVLCFSQKHIRFLECTRQGVRELELKDVPPDFDTALQLEEEKGQPARAGAATRGHAGAGFHGHGASEEVSKHKKDLARFAQLVNKGVYAALKDRAVPLLLAAVDYLVPIYREANTYAHLVDQAIIGNTDGRTAEDLGRDAWKIVEPVFLRPQELAVERYRALLAKGEPLAANDAREIVPAAYHGRVETLFVTLGRPKWGTYDPGTGAVFIHKAPEPGDEDLTDAAAVHTLSQGGRVYAFKPGEGPDGGPVGAILRY